MNQASRLILGFFVSLLVLVNFQNCNRFIQNNDFNSATSASSQPLDNQVANIASKLQINNINNLTDDQIIAMVIDQLQAQELAETDPIIKELLNYYIDRIKKDAAFRALLIMRLRAAATATPTPGGNATPTPTPTPTATPVATPTPLALPTCTFKNVIYQEGQTVTNTDLGTSTAVCDNGFWIIQSTNIVGALYAPACGTFLAANAGVATAFHCGATRVANLYIPLLHGRAAFTVNGRATPVFVPTNNTGMVDMCAAYTVSWGDGTTTAFPARPANNALCPNDTLTHTYATAGNYTVTDSRSNLTIKVRVMP